MSVFSEFGGQSDPGVLFGGGSDNKDNLGIFGNCKSSSHEHMIIECRDFYNSTVNRRLKMCFEVKACFLCGYTHGRFMYGKKCPNKDRAMKYKILCHQCLSEVASGQRNYPYMSVLCNKHTQVSTSVQIVQSLKNYHPRLEVAGMKFNLDLGEDWIMPTVGSKYCADKLVAIDTKSDVVKLECSTDKQERLGFFMTQTITVNNNNINFVV